MDEATFDQSKADAAAENEIYSEELQSRNKPWWKANFFISEPILFGTWDGVFTSCMINIFGVLIFLRTGWIVGNAGIGFSILIICLTALVALVAVLSAVGICERCSVEAGGIYSLLSRVLGARTGATVGILYSFGQAVSVSLYVIGFGESISNLFHQDNVWIARAVAVLVLLSLLGINIAGVQWVIRLQLVLLAILLVAVLDFVAGSFLHTSPENGVIGYDADILSNNTGAYYLSGENFFSVFGVFFPTATGVFAGINMSGDLKNPAKNIPIGTYSAVGVSTILYLVFAIILGATCARGSLQSDYMIAEKVSLTGVLFLAGLYISSVSSAMGGLYAAPRILQCIGGDGVIPIASIFAKGRGPNKVPVYSMAAVTAISVLFVFVGRINTLGPIVTIPFMITYAAVDFAYFALVTSPDTINHSISDAFSQHAGHDQEDEKLIYSKEPGFKQRENEQSYGTVDEKSECDRALLSGKLTQKYLVTRFFMRWTSLIGCLTCLVIMFAINWIYSLASIFLFLVIFIYIGIANPAVAPGIARLNVGETLKNTYNKLFRGDGGSGSAQFISSTLPAMTTTPAQLTEENDDFASRQRYHQSEVVRGEAIMDDKYND